MYRIVDFLTQATLGDTSGSDKKVSIALHLRMPRPTESLITDATDFDAVAAGAPGTGLAEGVVMFVSVGKRW
jgi:hypothetical protein